MNKRRLGDFFGVQCTLHQNKPLLTFLFCEVFHVIANYRTYSAVNRVHYNYGVIRCFIRVLLRKCQLFHRFTIPAIQSAKIEYLAPKNKQRHSAEAECRMFVCFPILFDRCRKTVIFQNYCLTRTQLILCVSYLQLTFPVTEQSIFDKSTTKAGRTPIVVSVTIYVLKLLIL